MRDAALTILRWRRRASDLEQLGRNLRALGDGAAATEAEDAAADYRLAIADLECAEVSS